MNQSRLAPAPLPSCHEERRALRQQGSLQQSEPKQNGNALADRIQRNVDQPVVQQKFESRFNLLVCRNTGRDTRAKNRVDAVNQPGGPVEPNSINDSAGHGD